MDPSRTPNQKRVPPFLPEVGRLFAQFLDESEAVLAGLALGDTLGSTVEFTSLADIRARFGPEGIKEPEEPFEFTDDAQMSIALAIALCNAKEHTSDYVMSSVREEFIKWLHSPSNTRAPGGACLRGAQKMAEGISWSESGDEDAKGCGSVMRVLPVGYLYQHHPQSLVAIATAQSVCTHAHPTAIASSIAAAYAVKLALDKAPLPTFIPKIIEFIGDKPRELIRKLEKVASVVKEKNEVRAMQTLGEGWLAEEALALALYCILRNPNDWTKTVQRAANSNGDSDSIACIAGGIQGARLGIHAIPELWRDRLEDGEKVRALSFQLAEKKLELIGGS